MFPTTVRERFPYFRSGRDSSVLFVDFNGIIANINLDLMNEIDTLNSLFTLDMILVHPIRLQFPFTLRNERENTTITAAPIDSTRTSDFPLQ